MKLSEILQRARQTDKVLRLGRMRGTAGALLTARLRDEFGGPILVVSPTSTRAEAFASAVRAYAPELEVRLFPRYDVPPYDRFSAHPDIGRGA
jgi:transcription-repair coupling factor (superfamily II helicase)